MGVGMTPKRVLWLKIGLVFLLLLIWNGWLLPYIPRFSVADWRYILLREPLPGDW